MKKKKKKKKKENTYNLNRLQEQTSQCPRAEKKSYSREYIIY